MADEATSRIQQIDSATLQRDIVKLNQQYEVLQHCRAYDRETLDSFRKRVVNQQQQITRLQTENQRLLDHLNPKS